MGRREKIEKSATTKSRHDSYRKNWDKNMDDAGKAWDGLMDMLKPKKKKKKPGKVHLNKEKVRKFKEGK